MTSEELKEYTKKAFIGMMCQTEQLTLQEFAITSVSLINFLTITKKIQDNQRKEASLFLCGEYNMGTGYSMDENILDGLATAIVNDKGMDLSKIKIIIDNI